MKHVFECFVRLFRLFRQDCRPISLSRPFVFERLERRWTMIAEGGAFAIDSVLDTSALLGPITAQADWGDGARTPLAVSSSPAVGPLRVRFGYDLDYGQFFNTAEKRAILQIAADMVFSRFTDTLAAIAPSGRNQWNAVFPNPTTGARVEAPIGNVAENELVIFVGARDLPGNQVAEGGGGSVSWSGSAAWGQTVVGRGQPGALNAIATDFGPWGGSLTVDSAVKWHFGTTTDGLDNDEYDFLTAVSHELMHVLGFGVAPSWHRIATTSTFQGSASFNANGGIAAPLHGDRAHWQDGTQNHGQEALMDPVINGPGIRKLPTPLDLAGLVDVGWSLIPQAIRVSGSHVYGDDGNYPVEVILSGARAGSRSTSIDLVRVTNSSPTLNARDNQIVQVGIPIHISDLGVFQDIGFGPAETFRYDIDWGDGTPKVEGDPTIDRFGSAGLPTLGSFDGSHTYLQTGNYTVRYRVGDDNGGVAEQTFVMLVTPAPELRLSINRLEISEAAGANAAVFLVDTIGLDNRQPITLQLISSDPGEASLPPTITVPAGASRVTLAVAAVDDALLDGTQTVQLYAQWGSLVSLPIAIQVLDHETIQVALNAANVREDSGPGAAVLRVTRSNTDTASPLDVQLTSSDPTAATVPARVTIPAGASSIDVSVTAVDDSVVDGDQHVQFSANAARYVGSTVGLRVEDYEALQWVEQGLSLAESSVTRPALISIKLPAPAPNTGTTLNLTTDIDGQLQFPTQVHIPAGQSSATVTISAIDDTLAESPKTVKLIANGPGYRSGIISIALTDDDRSVWTNSENVFDIDGNGSVDPIDILQIINALKRLGTGPLPSTREPLGPPYIDVNGNGIIEPLDVLVVINFLLRRSRPS